MFNLDNNIQKARTGLFSLILRLERVFVNSRQFTSDFGNLENLGFFIEFYRGEKPIEVLCCAIINELCLILKEIYVLWRNSQIGEK